MRGARGGRARAREGAGRGRARARRPGLPHLAVAVPDVEDVVLVVAPAPAPHLVPVLDERRDDAQVKFLARDGGLPGADLVARVDEDGAVVAPDPHGAVDVQHRRDPLALGPGPPAARRRRDQGPHVVPQLPAVVIVPDVQRPVRRPLPDLPRPPPVHVSRHGDNRRDGHVLELGAPQGLPVQRPSPCLVVRRPRHHVLPPWRRLDRPDVRLVRLGDPTELPRAGRVEQEQRPLSGPDPERLVAHQVD